MRSSFYLIGPIALFLTTSLGLAAELALEKSEEHKALVGVKPVSTAKNEPSSAETTSSAQRPQAASGERGLPVEAQALAEPVQQSMQEVVIEQPEQLLKESLDFDPAQAQLETLDSGLKVVSQPVPGEGQISVCTTLGVGASSDPRGQSGTVSALAEMLKDGGYRSRGQDYVALVQRRGLQSHVEVTRDATTFCTSGPASELALALWVAGGRFTSGALVQENLDAALELLYQRAESEEKNVFNGRAKARLRSLAFLGSESLAHHVEGKLESLPQLSLESVRRLHRDTYVARQSTISVVGGIEPKKLSQLLKQHLQKVKPGKTLAEFRRERKQQKTSRFSMDEDPTAKSPSVWYGWVVDRPDAVNATAAALSIATNERRLGRQLLKGAAPAVAMDLHLERGSALPLFSLAIKSRSNKAFTRIEGKLKAQLNTLSSAGPSKKELDEFRAESQRKAKQSLGTDQLRARELAWGVNHGRSPEEVLAPLSQESLEFNLTVEDVRQAARTILNERNRVSVEVYPKGWRDPWQTPMPHYHVVSKGETLGAIALKYGSTVPAIIKMNGRKRQQSIYPGDKLRVPRIKNAKKSKPPRHHVVKRGDTLGALAVRYSVGSSQIAAANGIGKSGRIVSGQKLRIPWGKKAPKATVKNPKKSKVKYSSYKVRRGDVLSTIAQRVGLSSKELAALNSMGSSTVVKVGQTLKVPAGKLGSAKKKRTSKPKPKFIWYKVRSGDTLSGIAKRQGITVRQIETLNGMNRKTKIFAGKKLKLPKK